MIKALIVDDEKNSCEALQLLLERSCPEIEIISTAHSGTEALKKIQTSHPQLVFLDIEMPNMNGFQLLEQLSKIDFELIFTTSYDQYAIKAFKFSAIDYLLKPVDREELEKAVEKVSKKLTNNINQQLDILLQKINQPSAPVQKIALPTMQGLELVSIDSIINCSANSNYTEFFLTDKRKVVPGNRNNLHCPFRHRSIKENSNLASSIGFPGYRNAKYEWLSTAGAVIEN